MFSQKKYLFFRAGHIKIGNVVRGVAQPGRVLAWGARGRRFESCHPDHKNKKRPCADFYFYSGYNGSTRRIVQAMPGSEQAQRSIKKRGRPPFFNLKICWPRFMDSQVDWCGAWNS